MWWVDTEKSGQTSGQKIIFGGRMAEWVLFCYLQLFTAV